VAAAVLWLPKVMVLCNAPPHGAGPHELRFYPRYHLDDTSLLCRHPLRSAPLALDTQVCRSGSASPGTVSHYALAAIARQHCCTGDNDSLLATYHPIPSRCFRCWVLGTVTATLLHHLWCVVGDVAG
jgi:hypothetical protein